jgi:predicted permease
VHTLLQDIRYAIRQLRKSPGFTIIALITLALGIGVNSALFSVVNGVLLNPLPYSNPDQLTAIFQTSATFGQGSISYPNFLDWQKDNRSFTAVAAYRNDDFNLSGQGATERIQTGMVTAEFFSVLGIQPPVGRNFTIEEDKPGTAAVAIISNGLWSRKFASSPDVVGKVLSLNGEPHTIIGVLPRGFRFNRDNDIYVPIGRWNDPAFRNRGISMGLKAIGRLKPDVTIQQASADLVGVSHNLATAYPDTNTGTGAAILPLKQSIVGDTASWLWILLAAVGFVLLIACANVANLTLVRSNARAREFAIRTALGATRIRILTQLLTESVLLGVVGGVLGLLLAAYGTQYILTLLPYALPRSGEVGIDSHVLVFTCAISVLAGVLFGFAPIFRLRRPNLSDTLKEGARGSSGTLHGTQRIFVVAEVALALVLLVGAGLMIRTLSALWKIDPGFNPQNVLTFSISYDPSLTNDPSRIRALLRDFHDRLGALPGVQSASVIGGSLPLQDDSEIPFWLDGQPKPASQSDMAASLFYLVEPEYLKTMQTPLLRGRFITRQDDEHAPPVIVIDEKFAQQYFPGQDPIGRHVNIEFLGKAEIIGIAGHVKHWGLDTDANEKIQAQLYIPITQIPDKFMPQVLRDEYVVRATNDPTALTNSIRNLAQQISPNQVAYSFESMEGVVADSLSARRFSMFLLGSFAVLALILASIGVYGVISYLVGQRTHEIGIRIALGAQTNDVVKMVVRQAARLAMIGVIAGLVCAYVATRFMSQLLYGVRASDPLTFGTVAILLSIVALLASYIPARRAAGVDPIVALRVE